MWTSTPAVPRPPGIRIVYGLPAAGQAPEWAMHRSATAPASRKNSDPSGTEAQPKKDAARFRLNVRELLRTPYSREAASSKSLRKGLCGEDGGAHAVSRPPRRKLISADHIVRRLKTANCMASWNWTAKTTYPGSDQRFLGLVIAEDGTRRATARSIHALTLIDSLCWGDDWHETRRAYPQLTAATRMAIVCASARNKASLVPCQWLNA